MLERIETFVGRRSIRNFVKTFPSYFPDSSGSLENMVTIFKNNAASEERKREICRWECEVNAGWFVFFFSMKPIWKKRRGTKATERERERERETVGWNQRQEYLTASVEYSQTQEPGNRYVAMVVVCAHSSLLYTRYRMHVIYVPMHIYPTEALRKRDSARLFKLLNFKLSLTYAN